MLDLKAALDEAVHLLSAPRALDPKDVPSIALNTLVSGIEAGALKGKGHLTELLRAAVNEASRRSDRISIAATGLAWLGSGIPTVEQEMESFIQAANMELTICAYSITLGATDILSKVSEAARQGVTVTIAINDFNSQPGPVKQILRSGLQAHPEHWRVYDFDPPQRHAKLHAKIIVVDRQAALLGSANLSYHGMVSNHEMALVVRGPTAGAIAIRIDQMLKLTSAVR